MTAAVTRREYSPLRTKVRTALVTVAVLGGVGTVCLAVIGPWAVRVFFGGKAYISGPVLALLGVGTILLMVTQVMQAVLIALGAHRLVVGAWLLGAVVFAGLILWPGNPLWTAVSAQLVGPAVIVLGMGSALIVLLSRRGTRPMSPSERWDGGSVPEKEMIEPGSAKNAATDRAEYTNRLVRLEGARWKQVLNVQAPYRWNMRRINLGYTLDVGCGLGRNLEHLDKNGVGVDHNRTSVEFARSRGLTVFTVEEFVSSDYAKPNSFDSILAAHLVEHLAEEESREVLASYLPFLRADGFVVFITPQERGYASDETHVQFMGFDEVTRLATELGLTVERTYSFPLPRIFGRVFTYNEFVVIARKP